MPEFSAQTDPTGTYLPLGEIVLRAGPIRRAMPALIDSGADRTVMPAELVSDILPFDDLMPVGRAGGLGSVEIRLAEAELSFGGLRFTDFVLVAAPGTSLRYPVLGRGDFFRRFAVCFHWSHSPPTFSIEPAA